MKILIVPTVREIYKNQFEYCVDIRLINFIKEIFKNSSIEIYNMSIKNNLRNNWMDAEITYYVM